MQTRPVDKLQDEVFRVPSRSKWRRSALSWLTAALVVAVTLLSTAAKASPQSFELLQRGTQDLSAGRYAAALKKFDAAAQADGMDAEAPFFQAVALNRMGRNFQAWSRLQQAKTLGVKHPEYAFELGWSLIGLQRWIEAVPQLERFERTNPGRGQTSELLGRAKLALEMYDEASAHFAEALRRDPALGPTVHFYQALLAQRTGKPEAVRGEIQAILQESPNSPTARAMSQQLATLAVIENPPAMGSAAKKPFQLSVSLGGGRNSNVIFLGSGIPLPLDITRQSASFVRATLNTSYTWKLENNDTLTAGYGFQGESYKSLGQANLRDHYVYGDYSHTFNSKWFGALRVSDQYTFIGGNSYRNQVVLRPAVALRHSPRAVTEFSYSHARSNYMFPNAPIQDRDGTTNAVSVSHYFNPRGSRFRFRAGGFYSRNSADGADFDSRSPGLFAGLSHPLGKQAKLDLAYSHTFDRYRNPNSLSAPAFSARRRDNGDALNVQVTHNFNQTLSGYLQFSHSRNSSNLPFFEYRQNVFGGGVVAHF